MQQKKIINNLVLFGFVLLKCLLQFNLVSPEYQLHRDEFLHLDQGKHLAWGYYSVPPFSSWISLFVGWLGNSIFWVKFFPAFFGALSIVVLWKTIEFLKGGLFALYLGAIAMLFSVHLRINLLFQPNSADIFFWTLAFYLLIRWIVNPAPKWWMALMTCLALGFLNKYNIVFWVMGIAPTLVFSTHRKNLLKPYIVYGIGLGLLIIAPHVYWQFKNEWPVFSHMRELSETQLVNVQRADFLREQVLFFLGSLYVLIAGLISLVWYPDFRKFRFLALAFLLSLFSFVWLKAKGYYAIGLYGVLLSFGAVYFEKLLQKGWKVYLKPVLLIVPMALFIPMVKWVFPVMSPKYIEENTARYQEMGLTKWEDGKNHALPQDFADMLGWKELAAKVDTHFNSLKNTGETLVLCDNYGQAGAINFYSANKNMAAVSFNADYINWMPLNKNIKHLILVKDIWDKDPKRLKEQTYFEEIMLVDSIENKHARERGTRIYMLKNARVSIADKLKEEIGRRKKK